MAKVRKPKFDPAAILREIAADPAASTTARVAACKALLALEQWPAEPDADGDLTTRALQLMKRNRRDA